jgi:hypothetical protein
MTALELTAAETSRDVNAPGTLVDVGMGWLPSCHNRCSIGDLKFAFWRGDGFFRPILNSCSAISFFFLLRVQYSLLGTLHILEPNEDRQICHRMV